MDDGKQVGIMGNINFLPLVKIAVPLIGKGLS